MSALSDALNEANVNGWSAREIARRSGDEIHFGTVAKYLKGQHGHPSEDVLSVFAEVLGVSLQRLRQLAGLPAGEQGPYTPPREADRLGRRQRRVVDELIRMLADTTTREGEGHAGPAPTSTGDGPHNVTTLQQRYPAAEWEDEAARPETD